MRIRQMKFNTLETVFTVARQLTWGIISTIDFNPAIL